MLVSSLTYAADSTKISVSTFDTVTVHKGLPRYVLHYSDDKPVNDPDYFYFGRIEVRREGDTSLIQVIIDTAEGITDFKAVDANFDGYLDWELDYNPMWTANEGTSFMLFDSSTGRFVADSAYSGFVNAEVDSQDSTIWSGGRSGGSSAWSETFKIVDKRPILIERDEFGESMDVIEKRIGGRMTIVDRTAYEEGGGDTVTAVHEKLIDGMLKVTRKTTMTQIEELPSNEYTESGPFQVDARGRYHIEKKITYLYGTDKRNRPYVDIVERTSHGNKWGPTKRTRKYLK